MIFQFVVGVVAMIFVTIFVRTVIKNCYPNWEPWKWVHFLKKAVLTIAHFISLDYWLAKKEKGKLENNEKQKEQQSHNIDEENDKRAEQRSKYIKTANHINLGFSIVLALILFCVLLIPCINECWYYFLFGMVAYRTMSRTLEIDISFCQDCITGGSKKSNLRKYDRMKLALLSLLEEAVLFSGVYTFTFGKAEWYKAIFAGMHSFMFSSYPFGQDCWLLSFISIYQVVCSIILVTLALTAYISAGESESEETSEPTDTETENHNDGPGKDKDSKNK